MTGTAQLASALALLLSFALIHVTGIGAAVRLCALQGLAAALAAGTHAWPHASAPVAFAALIAAVLNGVAMPLLLRHLADRSGIQLVNPTGRTVFAHVAAFVLTTLAVAATTHVRAAADIAILAAGLSMLLLGLLLITLELYRDMPAIGLLSAQNGIVLAASAVPGLSAVTFLVCAVPFTPGLVAIGMWLRRAC